MPFEKVDGPDDVIAITDGLVESPVKAGDVRNIITMSTDVPQQKSEENFSMKTVEVSDFCAQIENAAKNDMPNFEQEMDVEEQNHPNVLPQKRRVSGNFEGDSSFEVSPVTKQNASKYRLEAIGRAY